MSTRGVNFLDNWMAEHLPNAITDDPMAIIYLTEEAIKAAEREGIPPEQITEEVGSVFDVILQAMQHRDGSRAEGDESDKTAKLAVDLMADRLGEAGITHEQAEELIKRIGTDWDSLIREAHFLKDRSGETGTLPRS